MLAIIFLPVTCAATYAALAVKNCIVPFARIVCQYIGEYPRNWIRPPVDFLFSTTRAKLESTKQVNLFFHSVWF